MVGHVTWWEQLSGRASLKKGLLGSDRSGEKSILGDSMFKGRVSGDSIADGRA